MEAVFGTFKNPMIVQKLTVPIAYCMKIPFSFWKVSSKYVMKKVPKFLASYMVVKDYHSVQHFITQ